MRAVQERGTHPTATRKPLRDFVPCLARILNGATSTFKWFPSSQFPFRRQRAASLPNGLPPSNVVTVTLTDVPIDLNPTYLALEWPPKEN